jgi:hypothetical protein
MNIRIFLTLAMLVLLFNFNSLATTHYVNLNSTNATPPFTEWNTAATNIQNAVDVSASGDLVLVTNGIYLNGAVTNNGQGYRVSVTNALTLQSVNGPAATVIDGGGTVSCVYLTDGSVLSGFTITHGHGTPVGGGIYCASTFDESGYPLPHSAQIINCLVTTNYATIDGGGIFQGIVSNSIISFNRQSGATLCTLYNSLLTYNFGSGSQQTAGGAAFSSLTHCLIISNINNGVYSSDLNNCLVISNGGFGTYACNLTNCTVCGNSSVGVIPGYASYGISICNSIIYYNAAGNWSRGVSLGVNAINCCITPLPPGAGNITNSPLFVNMAAGNFHLASNSPCINAGNNALVVSATDYGNNPRIVGGTVDIGAYEFQSPTSILSYAWAQQYGLSTDGSADFANPDGDGLNNWQEWIAGTNPTNAASVLKILSPSNSMSGLNVSWQSVSGKTYFLQRASDLTAQPAFSALKSNLNGQASSTVYLDTSATNGGPYFYRVGVQ